VIAEGTLSVGSAAAGLSVTDRSAALPSSSTSKTPRVVDEPNAEAEGSAPSIGQPPSEEGDTVSVTALRNRGAGTAADNATKEGEAARVDGEPFGPGGLESQLEQTREREEERLSRISEQISENLDDGLKLKFATDEETGMSLFQLVEQDTGEVVRQFPPEEMLDFLEKFRDFSGFLLSEQA